MRITVIPPWRAHGRSGYTVPSQRRTQETGHEYAPNVTQGRTREVFRKVCVICDKKNLHLDLIVVRPIVR